ncbi:hypothetical protein Cgig2_005213 [Carnegiea gigantea]|uniref:Uncharacterized protein n=1 Tax=Carnegiea gigantea TaxID=171969 RepID=A0A9Q1JVJ6_9CARY|nr:hypothetical protein Cgig2_005213 [Carnegiea gigantea]
MGDDEWWAQHSPDQQSGIILTLLLGMTIFINLDSPQSMLYLRTLTVEDIVEMKSSIHFVGCRDSHGDYTTHLQHLMTHLVIATETPIPDLNVHVFEEGEEAIYIDAPFVLESERNSSTRAQDILKSLHARERSPCPDFLLEVELLQIDDIACPYALSTPFGEPYVPCILYGDSSSRWKELFGGREAMAFIGADLRNRRGKSAQ